MCSTCKSTTYGQEQPEARKADAAKLKRVIEARKSNKK